MKGIILASHGGLAEGMFDTLKIFCGEPEQFEVLSLLPQADVQEFMVEMKAAIQRVDTGDGVVVFCDLLFGSPCNCCAKIIHDTEDVTVDVITGMNLSMVLEFVNAREQGMDTAALVYTGQQGIVDFNRLLASRKG